MQKKKKRIVNTSPAGGNFEIKRLIYYCINATFYSKFKLTISYFGCWALRFVFQVKRRMLINTRFTPILK